MYLAALDAVAHRLLGGDPTLPPQNYTEDAKASDGLLGRLDERVGMLGHPPQGPGGIPVFWFDYVGNAYERLPCFSVECIDTQPRLGNFIACDPDGSQEDYIEELPGTIEILDATGETLTGAPLRTRRAIEIPYDFMVEVRAYSDDPLMSAKMVSWVSTVFHPVSYLTVRMADGSTRTWDVEQTDYRDLDKREVARTGAREYAKVWTFRVEGYNDNTLSARLETTGRGRNLLVRKENP